MDIKVLFSGGDGAFIIKLDNQYYLVNIETGILSRKHSSVDSILKFGYFEKIDGANNEIMNEIKEVIALNRYVATSKGTIVIGKIDIQEENL